MYVCDRHLAIPYIISKKNNETVHIIQNLLSMSLILFSEWLVSSYFKQLTNHFYSCRETLMGVSDDKSRFLIFFWSSHILKTLVLHNSSVDRLRQMSFFYLLLVFLPVLRSDSNNKWVPTLSQLDHIFDSRDRGQC